MSSLPPFKKILIANRGEIALRILRAATELKIRTVAIYSYEDRFALYRYKADEAYQIGEPGKPIDAYLNWPTIIAMAKKHNIDAIHPGYGFLSENADFATACKENGIKFIGPSADVLKAFGDKVAARENAVAASLPVVPGTENPIPDLEVAKKSAKAIGYPVTLKAVMGGGGKGIRMIADEKQLVAEFDRAKSEAKTNFGFADIYLEKKIEAPKHIEVQILADEHGNIVHLYERDCSIQRRHQKVVEVAPALGISAETKKNLHDYAIKIAKHVNYVGLGTVEFLVSSSGEIYFLEVNPRIQVEHTVTEMITGIDLVHASILVAAGFELSHELIGIDDQDAIPSYGAAIQCRITTEDPSKDFAPDTGQIIAYRPACGFGIRLDEGLGTAGADVTPYYDSLLVKVTAWARTMDIAAAKMHRSLSEFRIRGIKHNIPLLRNVMNNTSFLDSSMTTDFFESHPELFDLRLARDRATKLLRFISNATVNDPHGLGREKSHADFENPKFEYSNDLIKEMTNTGSNAKEIFDKGGVTELTKWIKTQQNLLLTDTTMRDAHQSLFATRLRSIDIEKATEFYRLFGRDFFSLEVWGGATFDTCMRFLREDPWERLAMIREKIPNALLQMLIRGDNAVGYTNYPRWVVEDFIRLTVESGLDVFRIFDCLNQPDKMQIAIDSVKKNGAIAEVCICYTGNVVDPKETKYTLNYYLEIAKQLQQRGADILCIKDMAGLLRPHAARVLVDALKQTVDLPIHLHTHDTSGAGVTMLLEASKAGCDIVDGAVSSMSGLTSQPSLNALVAIMGGNPNCPDVPLPVLDAASRYWETVRTMYRDFDPGIKSTSTEVYEHEIPGGQYSNLFHQAKKVGVSSAEFYQLTQRYKEVNELLGNIVKVTPSSKVVGDLALLLQKQGLTGPQLKHEKPKLDYPDSVVSFFKGEMGEPYGGFPEDIRQLVLQSVGDVKEATSEVTGDTFEDARRKLSETLGREVKEREVISYRLYPKVYLDFEDHKASFGHVSGLPTPVFFYGLQQGVEIETDLENGKRLIIEMIGLSEPDKAGKRTVFFKLNGFPRSIKVYDESSASEDKRIKANRHDENHIGATMPGKVLDVLVAVGDEIEEGQVLLITESMKMEYALSAKKSGKINDVLVRKGDVIEEGDLLLELSSQ